MQFVCWTAIGVSFILWTSAAAELVGEDGAQSRARRAAHRCASRQPIRCSPSDATSWSAWRRATLFRRGAEFSGLSPRNPKRTREANPSMQQGILDFLTETQAHRSWGFKIATNASSHITKHTARAQMLPHSPDAES